MPFDESMDLDAMFSADDFASNAIWNGKTIQIIFDNEYVAQLTGEVPVASASPRATCRTADVEDAVQGDRLKVGTVTYNVIGVEPDGTGVTVLVLSKD